MKNTVVVPLRLNLVGPTTQLTTAPPEKVVVPVLYDNWQTRPGLVSLDALVVVADPATNETVVVPVPVK